VVDKNLVPMLIKLVYFCTSTTFTAFFDRWAKIGHYITENHSCFLSFLFNKWSEIGKENDVLLAVFMEL
jgi:hypothetical protein